MSRRVDLHARRWTKEDDTRLIWLSEDHDIPALAHALGRTGKAIRARLYRNNIIPRVMLQRSAEMGASEVAAALGVAKGNVGRWIVRGELKARKMRSLDTFVYSISADSVENFLRSGGCMIATLKPDPLWRDEVAEAREAFQKRYINTIDLARAFCLDDLRIRHRSSTGFPNPVYRFNSMRGGHWYDRYSIKQWLDDNPRYWTRLLHDELDSAEAPVSGCKIPINGAVCGNDINAGEMCKTHYGRWLKYGDPLWGDQRKAA